MRANSLPTKLAVAGGLALAVAGGGAALALADTPTETATVSPTEQHGQHEQTLADKLGVTVDQLREAMRTAHDSGQDRSTALAKALGVDQSVVDGAFNELHSEHEARMREDLSSRLDTAITEGKLTSADKDSVLKAFDAGVLAPGQLKEKGMGGHGMKGGQGPHGMRGEAPSQDGA